jgi:hypothetical protein
MGNVFVLVCDFNGKWLRISMCFVCIHSIMRCGKQCSLRLYNVLLPFFLKHKTIYAYLVVAFRVVSYWLP